MTGPQLPTRLLGTRLQQPDARSCGAAALVAARMLRDPAYATLARPRFAEACLAMHRRVTGPVDVLGAWQPPWVRALGTPPWAVARQLSWTYATPYSVRRVRRSAAGRRSVVAELEAATDSGLPAALYVGSAWLPRHVTLVVGPGLATYEPASGRVLPVDTADFVQATLDLAGWSVPWFAVVPRDTLPPRAPSR